MSERKITSLKDIVMERKDTEIWKQVKRMEEVFNEHKKVNDDYHMARATMLANFGEKGSIKKGLVNSSQTLTQMIVEAFNYLIEENTYTEHKTLEGGRRQ